MTNEVTIDRTVAEAILPEPALSGPPSTLELLNRGELDAQITTARRFPRSLARFRADLMAMVRLDPETAASCFYALPRRQRQDDGTYKRVTITGPSVRLAEMAASAYGNIRVGARIVLETDREAVAHGVAHDLQTNYAVTTETSRRIVDRNGNRYGDDMLTVTRNAACAVAWRNAALKVIPRAFINPAVAMAMKVAAGEATSLVQTRKSVLADFATLGVPAAAVCLKLERPGVEDLDLEDVSLLRGLLTALREGTTTVAAEFPSETPPGEPKLPATERLRAAVRKRHAAQPPAAPPGELALGDPPPAPPAPPDEKPR